MAHAEVFLLYYDEGGIAWIILLFASIATGVVCSMRWFAFPPTEPRAHEVGNFRCARDSCENGRSTCPHGMHILIENTHRFIKALVHNVQENSTTRHFPTKESDTQHRHNRTQENDACL